MRLDELTNLVSEILNIPKPDTPEYEIAFSPRVVCAVSDPLKNETWTSEAIIKASKNLSLRKGSALIHCMATSTSFSRAVADIAGLSFIMVTQVLRSDFPGKGGVINKDYPFMGAKTFWIFLYSVTQAQVDEIQTRLGTWNQGSNGVASIYFPQFRSICPVLPEGRGKRDAFQGAYIKSPLRKKKTKKEKKS